MSPVSGSVRRVAINNRLDELVHLLRRRADWTSADLASELSVSRRTVLRDIDRLRSRGYVVSAMAGPGGGMHLEPTSVMVTSQLAGDEVVALIVSIALARATPGVPFVAGAELALAKIEASLPRKRAEEVQHLLGRIMIGDPAPSPGEIARIDSTLVACFEKAFSSSRTLAFVYTDAHEAKTLRDIEPHGLLVRAPLWYVIAWDTRRKAARLFRADRIRRPRVTERSFTPRPYDLVRGVCPDAKPTPRTTPPRSRPGR